MEIINFNDYIRNEIAKKLNKSEDKYDNNVKKLYNEITKNKEKCLNIIEVMAITSYAINYLPFERFYEDKKIVKQVEFFDTIKNTRQLADELNEDIFKDFCDDVILFEELDGYGKKKHILSLLNIEDVIEKFPSYINDLAKYNLKYDKSVILEHYNMVLLNSNDKQKAYDETIKFAVEFLIKLEEDEPENYEELFNDIINDIYYYDKYLISKGINISDASMDLYNMIKDENNNLMYFLANNVPLLKSILNDYLNFCTLDEEHKKELDMYKNANTNFFGSKPYCVLNINSAVRKYLYSMFEAEDTDYNKSYKLIDSIVKSDAFGLIADVLYNDLMILKCYDSLVTLDDDIDEDDNDELEYLKELYDMEEFKENLINDRDAFLDAINFSVEYCFMGIPEKREMIEKLSKNNMFSYFLNKNYILDVLDYNRKYELSDACSFYYDALEDERDKKISIAQAADLLCDDLIMLYSYNEDEYRDIFYKISEVFYKNFKYKRFIGKDILDEEVNIINLMETNFDKYLKYSSDNLKIREIVINGFYEFVSLNDVQKQNIIDYYNELEGGNKSKNFIKK